MFENCHVLADDLSPFIERLDSVEGLTIVAAKDGADPIWAPYIFDLVNHLSTYHYSRTLKSFHLTSISVSRSTLEHPRAYFLELNVFENLKEVIIPLQLIAKGSSVRLSRLWPASLEKLALLYPLTPHKFTHLGLHESLLRCVHDFSHDLLPHLMSVTVKSWPENDLLQLYDVEETLKKFGITLITEHVSE